MVSTPVSHPSQAKAVLLLREVWSPMSDAQIPVVMGTLAALTKDATWTYHAQQVLGCHAALCTLKSSKSTVLT